MEESYKPISNEQAILKIKESPEGREIAYQCYYDWDIQAAYNRFYRSEEWKAVTKLISIYRPPSNISLDLGAGNGVASYALFRTNHWVISLEPDPSELVGYGAIKKYKKIEPINLIPISGLGEHLPFKNRTFGLVYMRQTLHHSKDLPRMLNEIARVLVPGGILIATREHIIDDETSLQSFLKNHPTHRYTQTEGAFLLKDYLQAVKAAGFKLEKLFLSWDSVINHYPMSDEKVRDEYQRVLKSHFGAAGEKLIDFPWVEKILRRYNSIKDRTPGRMISFVARA